MSGTPLEIERKVLIDAPDLILLEAAATSISHIEQTYLRNDDGLAERVRRREIRDASGTRVLCTHTRKRAVSAGVVEEDEREVDDVEYAVLLSRADEARVPVVKTRYVVPWAGHVLEIDRFHSPRALWLLEVEYDDAAGLTEPLDLPTWVPVIREVTGDDAYANYSLALP